MKLIDRYVFTAFVRVLTWALVAFAVIFLLVDLFDHLGSFLDNDASALAIGRYYLFQLPFVIDLVLPVSMLLASLFTFAALGKNNEYSALMTAGVSLFQISRSILIFALLIVLAAGLFRETVVPQANRRQDDVLKIEIEGESADPLRGRSNFNLMDGEGRLYVVRRFRTQPPSMESVSIQAFDDSTMVSRLDAARASWENDRWVLHDCVERRFAKGSETMQRFAQLELDAATPDPDEFARLRVEPDAMGYRELQEFARRVGRTGGDPRPYQAVLGQKLSFPFVHGIFVLLGLGLGAGKRRTTLWSGFSLTVGLSLGYFLFMSFGLTLGRSGTIPMWASAWTGNILYGLAGAALFLRSGR